MSTAANAYVDVTINGSPTSYTLGRDSSTSSTDINVAEGDSVTLKYRIKNNTDTDENSWRLYNKNAGDVPIDHTDGTQEASYTLYCKNTVLPVEYISGEYNSLNKTLNWVTASEINNDYYTIGIGTFDDNENFIAIDSVIINGKGNTNDYSYYTQSLNVCGKYIQLSQTDFNGKRTVLDSFYADCEISNSKFEIYPNPSVSGNSININIPDNFVENGTLCINNLSGQAIITDYIIDNNVIKIDTDLLKTGIYIVIIKNRNETISKKLIIR